MERPEYQGWESGRLRRPDGRVPAGAACRRKAVPQ